MSLVAAGCSADDDPVLTPIANEQLFQGRYVTLHAEPGTDVCPASLESADRFVEQTAAFLGVPPRHIDYYLYQHETYSCVQPGRGGGGESCALRGRPAVMSDQWILQHEIVHEVAIQLGDAPAFLEEGVAVMLSYPPTDGAPQVVNRGVHLEDRLESEAFASLDAINMAPFYEGSASFLRFVVDRYGAAALRQWYQALDNGSSADATRQAFAHATGATLDDALRDWRAEPTSTTDAAHLRLLECAWPPVGADTGEEALACNGAETHADGAHQFETVDLDDDGLYAFDLSGQGAFQVRVAGCDDAHAPWGAAAGSSGSVVRTLAYLHHGRQSMWTQRVTTTPGATRRWAFQRLGAQPTACEEAPEVVVPAQQAGGVIFHSATDGWQQAADDPSQRVTWLRFTSDHATTLTIQRVYVYNSLDIGDPRALDMSVCFGDCGAPAQCQTVRAGFGVSQPIAAQTPVTVALRTTPSPVDEILQFTAP